MFENIYFSEEGGHQVRKIEASTNLITTIAGISPTSTTYVASSNGRPATSAALANPYQLFVDNSISYLFVAVASHNNVRAVNLLTGIITLFAGFSGSTLQTGPATSALLDNPRGIWKDTAGNVFVSEYNGHRVKRIDSLGIISLVAGSGVVSATGASTSAMIGDGGPPTAATFYNPWMMFSDSSGALVVADRDNQKIRKVFDFSPTLFPTIQPSHQPTLQPSCRPSVPTSQPSSKPSKQPSSQPSLQPSMQPTEHPSSRPSDQPSNRPSEQPSSRPSEQPSNRPSNQSSSRPSDQPSSRPSEQPSSRPSDQPSNRPSEQPSSRPSEQPSSRPSEQPSSRPSEQPSSRPSKEPFNRPFNSPSIKPTVVPSSLVMFVPSSQPSSQPSRQPKDCPSSQPSRHPTSQPTRQPSRQPSGQSSKQPVNRTSGQPTSTPVVPSFKPSSVPSIRPSFAPSNVGDTLKPTSPPTASPTGSLPLNTRVSVNFTAGVIQQLKIVLPFMFTNAVFDSELSDIVIDVPKRGSNYVLNGMQIRTTSQVSISALTKIYPAISYDYSARAVNNAGDVNGDTFDDLIIGAPYASTCYVLFGTKHGFVNMTEGFTILGAASSDLTGWSVSGAGDVNNDTFADVIIGAPYAGSQSSGAVFVIYGHGWPFTVIDLSALKPKEGHAIFGAEAGDYLGVSVSGAGDVNGDGSEDVVIGALRSNAAFAGAAYIVHGSLTKPSVPLQLPTTSSAQVTVLNGASYTWFGYSVSGAGNVNGDRFNDVIIGSVPRKTSFGTPVSYVVYGAQIISVVKVATMTAIQGVVITGGGVVVSGVGDINGDGFDDVMVGSNYGFDKGAGFAITSPQNFTAFESASPIPVPSLPPSLYPSVLPSVRPTRKPSAPPSMQPTQPTLVPTQAPSGPTLQPSMRPSQPTSRPTSQPTAPSLAPTQERSIGPTTQNPSSVYPSLLPTPNPTLTNTMRMPTTVKKSARPSKYPIVRPSFAPTKYNTNITYIDQVYSSGGVFDMSKLYVNHIVNTSQSVLFKHSVKYSMYTFIPHSHSSVTIQNFTLVTDIINLSHFDLFTDFTKLNISQISSEDLSTRRHLRSKFYFVDTCIFFSDSQTIVLLNITKRALQRNNFLFAIFLPVSDNNNKLQTNQEASFTVEVVGGSLAFILLLYLIYKLILIWQEEQLSQKMKRFPTNFEDIKNQNPTYISFIGGDSDFGDISSDGESESSDSESSFESDDSSSENSSESSESGYNSGENYHKIVSSQNLTMQDILTTTTTKHISTKTQPNLNSAEYKSSQESDENNNTRHVFKFANNMFHKHQKSVENILSDSSDSNDSNYSSNDSVSISSFENFEIDSHSSEQS